MLDIFWLQDSKEIPWVSTVKTGKEKLNKTYA